MWRLSELLHTLLEFTINNRHKRDLQLPVRINGQKKLSKGRITQWAPKLPLPCLIQAPHKTRGSSSPHPKRHLHQFRHFSTAHGYIQQTDRHTNHATAAATAASWHRVGGGDALELESECSRNPTILGKSEIRQI